MEDHTNIVKSVPKEAWSQLAKTACATFEKLIYPLTATTEGIGRLIELRFAKLQDEQKIIAAKCIEEAYRKVEESSSGQREDVVIKPSVVYVALDNADNQTDRTIRDLWANLLANEFIDGGVHPEIAKLLSRLTSSDAILLLKIAQQDESTPLTIKVLKALASSTTLGLFNERRTFNHVHLEKLGLITELERVWILNTAGRELMRVVSDPE
ncbi:MAG: Abi-alpha family protein [Sedimenticola sp.]